MLGVRMQVISAFSSLGATLKSVTLNYTAPADAIYNVIISKLELHPPFNPSQLEQGFNNQNEISFQLLTWSSAHLKCYSAATYDDALSCKSFDLDVQLCTVHELKLISSWCRLSL